MPIYVYEVIVEGDDEPGQVFEVRQSINAPPLTVHPISGLPVRRIIQAPTIPGKWSEIGMRKSLSDKNLNELGFTKYVKAGDGVYEKRAGAGPNVINSEGNALTDA